MRIPTMDSDGIRNGAAGADNVTEITCPRYAGAVIAVGRCVLEQNAGCPLAGVCPHAKAAFATVKFLTARAAQTERPPRRKFQP